ncbi:3-methyladenine DNA glycosylase [Nocardioides marinus]|uniref:3-methyladenine DNA glycosylase n=1 Tax=Nocardioides marinus TaxID=374514 RepID=A0A7Y9YEM5_9ACTN|nr:3-methyladenine DNA glycosylase [Nocardioides marinus]NYI10803.1 hypothetical protein [Nocardioides marinus]
MQVGTVLSRAEWEPLAEAHAARVDRFVRPHLERREARVKHPVHDFLFTYYSQRPAQLRRWHPGVGVALEDAPEHAGWKGYRVSTTLAGARCSTTGPAVDGARCSTSGPADADARSGARVEVDPAYVASQRPLVEAIRRLLVATASRPAQLGCFGLHEWAMVHRASEHGTRHEWPLRLGERGTDEVVEGHRITCTHFDAFRFFTPSARPLNTLSPGSKDREEFEQPGCLHSGMDLYKHAFRLSPMVPSDLVADCFELAWDIRVLDMRASPYDLADLGLEPVRIETAEGKRTYAAAQAAFAERGAPLRARLVEACDALLV